MKLIQDYIDRINEEICGAKEYAEDYVLAKVMKNPNRAKLYWDMANDEIKHAMNMYAIAIEDIKSVSEVHDISEEDTDLWNSCMKHYAESIAVAKKMLE